MENTAEKPKLSPEKYWSILKGLSLNSISLKNSKSSINIDVKPLTELSIKIKDEAEFYCKEENQVFVLHHFYLDARKEGSKSKYIQIEVTFLIKLESKEIFNEDFFDIYKTISLHLNTWPYFREYVNQITSRMNIPPLSLPFYKSPM